MGKLWKNIAYLIPVFNTLINSLELIENEEENDDQLRRLRRLNRSGIINVVHFLIILLEVAITFLESEHDYDLHMMIQCLNDYEYGSLNSQFSLTIHIDVKSFHVNT